jgi:hypothetical protein
MQVDLVSLLYATFSRSLLAFLGLLPCFVFAATGTMAFRYTRWYFAECPLAYQCSLSSFNNCKPSSWVSEDCFHGIVCVSLSLSMSLSLSE